MGKRWLHRSVGVAVALTIALAPNIGSAQVSEPPAPSVAATLQVGTPYTGSFSRTDRGYGWMRLPAIRRNDAIFIAVDNAHRSQVRFCMIPPVDDFGADAALKNCDQWSAWVDPGRKSRLRLPYSGATGQAYLVIYGYCSNCIGAYTVTLEKVERWLSVGWAKKTIVSRTFALVAFARYGDNTAAEDGTAVTLMWKPDAAGRRAWRKVASTPTIKGRAVLRGTLPLRTRGTRIDLTACAGDNGPCANLLSVKVR